MDLWNVESIDARFYAMNIYIYIVRYSVGARYYLGGGITNDRRTLFS